MNSGTLRVLLIEDNPGDARLVAELLRDARGSSFLTEHEDRLASALARLPQGGIDAVLLDLSLPDSHGVDTVATVHSQVPDLPIVVLTGSNDPEQGLQAIKAGAQDYLYKGSLGSGQLLERVLSYAIERQSYILRLRHEKTKAIRSHRNLDEIINRTVDGVIVVDGQGTILLANPAAEKLLGRAAVDLPGGQLGIPLGGGDTEVHLSPSGGEEVVAEMRVVGVDWDASQAVLVILHDITERRRLEQKEKELAHTKDEMVSTVSHELRTPLHAIKAFLDLLRNGKVREAVTQKEFLTRAADETDRLMSLVDDLLDIARIEAGRLTFRCEAFDLDDVVSSVLASLKAFAAEQGCSVQYQLPQSPVTALADPQRVRQVLINLVGNAIKYSRPHTAVVVSTRLLNGMATIDVVDRGVGIAEEDIPRLFDRFYQVDDGIQHSGGSTGLGLHISRRIVEGLGGNLSVRSELGMGSTFTVALPADGAAAELALERELVSQTELEATPWAEHCMAMPLGPVRI